MFWKIKTSCHSGSTFPDAANDGLELGCGALYIRLELQSSSPGGFEPSPLAHLQSVQHGGWGHGFVTYVFSFASQQSFGLEQVAPCLSFPLVKWK